MWTILTSKEFKTRAKNLKRINQKNFEIEMKLMKTTATYFLDILGDQLERPTNSRLGQMGFKTQNVHLQLNVHRKGGPVRKTPQE
uniref:Uncharacterized protein n=1 Tax=Timema tahoe TaxID=61484 RepID=A0A7R9IMY8_9NEOP|nr:unnamed protein product [Timema tahoe]